MFIITMIGMAFYGAIALLFVILSTAELYESGRSTAARLTGMIACSFFWPVTVVVLSAWMAFSRDREPLFQPVRGRPMRLSHHSH